MARKFSLRTCPMLLALAFLAGGPLAGQSRVDLIQESGYPELLVDGRPFFVYGASFPYRQIPRPDWGRTLGALRSLGINTVRLEVDRAWHQAGDSSFDLEGRTNPQRDLLGLILQVTAAHLGISLAIDLQGDPAALRRWVEILARRVVLPNSAQTGGAILWIHLEAAPAPSGRHASPADTAEWARLEAARSWMTAQGISLPFSTGLAWKHSPEIDPPFWLQGWAGPSSYSLNAESAPQIESQAELLGTSDQFPAVAAALPLGPESLPNSGSGHAADPFLFTRLLVQNGIRGLFFSSSVQWNDALPLSDGKGSFPGPAAEWVSRARRNGMLVSALGPWLASAHEDAEFGLGYMGNAYAALSPEQRAALLKSAVSFQEFSASRNWSTAWVDIDREPMHRLARHSVLIIPQQVLDDGSLKDGIVAKFRDYIRTGGTLAFLGNWPAPQGFGLDLNLEAPRSWENLSAYPVRTFKSLDSYQRIWGYRGAEAAIVGMRQTLGYGHLVLYGLNFFEPAKTSPQAGSAAGAAESRPGEDLDKNFQSFVLGLRLRPTVLAEAVDSMRVTLLDSDSGPGRLLCLINLSNQPRQTGAIQILARDGAWALPPISIGPRDALSLPLEIPLSNGDFLLYATAEFLGQTPEGYLRFYAPYPANASMRLTGRISPLHFDIPVSSRPDGLVTLQILATQQRKARVVVIAE
ncbi:MAG: beta-galactosidase [Acidobacteria bacterium]|nr:beta-galactosidase [Acidobacteriota bacterium]